MYIELKFEKSNQEMFLRDCSNRDDKNFNKNKKLFTT